MNEAGKISELSGQQAKPITLLRNHFQTAVACETLSFVIIDVETLHDHMIKVGPSMSRHRHTGLRLEIYRVGFDPGGNGLPYNQSSYEQLVNAEDLL